MKLKHELSLEAMTRIKLLRIRFKISYIAFKNQMTLSQLIFTRILKTHEQLTKEGSIPLYDPFLSQKIKTFEKILSGKENCSFKSLI